MSQQELCAYIRKSVLKDGQASDSPEIQRAAIERWNQASGLYKLIWFEDVDYTGLNENRPDWQRLLQHLPHTHGVVVYNYTKTHRNVRDYLTFYDEHIAPFGKILVDVTNPMLDLRTTDGRFMATIFMAGAEQHARKTSDLVRDKAAFAVTQKGQHWGRTPYGCDRDAKTKHLIPSVKTYFYDPITGQAEKAEEGELPAGWEIRYYFDGLRLIYGLYAEGCYSSTDVAIMANDTGWRLRSHGGAPVPFDRIAVYRILRNWRVYGGNVTSGQRVLPGGHQPILPVELTQRVGEVLEQRHHVHYSEKASRTIYLLSGVLECEVCHQWLTGQLNHAQYRYYRHTDARPERCQERMVRSEPVDQLIRDMIMSLLDLEPILQSLAAKIHTALQLASRGKEASDYLHRKTQERERLIDLRVSGLLSREDFIARLEPIQAEIDRLESRGASQNILGNLEGLTARLMANLSQFPQASPQDARRIVRGLIHKIFIRDRQITSIVLTNEAAPLFSMCKLLQKGSFPQQLTGLDLVEVPLQYQLNKDILI